MTLARTHRPAFRWGNLIVLVVLSVGLAATILPFVWMVLGAFKTNAEIMSRPVTWWPQHPTLDNFRAWLFEFDIVRPFLNSVILAGATVATTLLFSSMVGWALAKMTFPGKNAIIVVVLSTMFVPGIVTLIPQFVLIANLGMVNTYWGLILPGMVGAFGVFLMGSSCSRSPTRCWMPRASTGPENSAPSSRSCCLCARRLSRRWRSSRSWGRGTASSGR